MYTKNPKNYCNLNKLRTANKLKDSFPIAIGIVRNKKINIQWEKEIKNQDEEKFTKGLMVRAEKKSDDVLQPLKKLALIKNQKRDYLVNTNLVSDDIGSLKP